MIDYSYRRCYNLTIAIVKKELRKEPQGYSRDMEIRKEMFRCSFMIRK